MRGRSSSRSPDGDEITEQTELTETQRMALNTEFDSELKAGIEQLRNDRVYKRLNYLDSPQSARVKMEGRGDVMIFSSNN
jgi:hypothetical protein